MTLVLENIGGALDAEKWLSQAGSPKAELADEKPQGETVDYDKLIRAWREGEVK